MMSPAARLRAARQLTATVDAVRTALQTPSPWAEGSHLNTITWDELYPGMAGLAITRAEAMAVPAMARARHLIVATAARLPLQAWRGATALDPQPIWTYRADGHQSTAARMAGTLDDLIFYGESLWVADRDNEGQIIRATHVPYSDWSTDADGYLTVHAERIPASRAVHIPGMHEGVLTFGGPTIRGASRTLAAAVDVAEHPMRLELHDTGDYPMIETEARQLVADARAAMASGSGVIYTTPGIDAKLHPVDTGALLVDGRESFAVDVARIAGIPSAMIDAHSRGATMTYSTTADVIEGFLHLGLTLYLTPITARLSLDDVSPRGTEIRFATDPALGAAALVDEPGSGDPAP
jgi:hypothetical protein